ncbi:hypothetical protein KC333_g63 [Hortaea werneckii]|nr:hypothetical protein KC333_g63 [Hortaea werneckii]
MVPILCNRLTPRSSLSNASHATIENANSAGLLIIIGDSVFLLLSGEIAKRQIEKSLWRRYFFFFLQVISTDNSRLHQPLPSPFLYEQTQAFPLFLSPEEREGGSCTQSVYWRKDGGFGVEQRKATTPFHPILPFPIPPRQLVGGPTSLPRGGTPGVPAPTPLPGGGINPPPLERPPPPLAPVGGRPPLKPPRGPLRAEGPRPGSVKSGFAVRMASSFLRWTAEAVLPGPGFPFPPYADRPPAGPIIPWWWGPSG